MKLMVYLAADPREPVSKLVTLSTKKDGDCEEVASQKLHTLSATALLVMKE